MARAFKSLVLVVAVCAATLATGAARGAQFRSGESVQGVGNYADLVAAAGRDVTLSAATRDDSFATNPLPGRNPLNGGQDGR